MKHIKLYEEFINESDSFEITEAGEFAGWIAFFGGKRLEITKDEAKDLWAAKQLAIKKLNVPKSKQGLLAISPAVDESESIDEAVKVDVDLAQITVDVLADENKKFHYEFYLSNMERDMIKDRYGKLPRGFAGPTTSMLAGEILSPLAGDDIYTDDVDLVKGDKTVMTLKPSTTWADVKKALKI